MIRALTTALVTTTLLLVGASDANAWGCRWMNSGNNHPEHIGWCWSTDEDHLSNCGSPIGCGMYHLAHWDISEEDQMRIEAILEEAMEEIEEILAEYDQESSRTDATLGCRCCH